jgi:hypothetical protein
MRRESGIPPGPQRRCEALHPPFAQILGKLYFFELRENLRLILFDYEPKRSGRANAAFNAPC